MAPGIWILHGLNQERFRAERFEWLLLYKLYQLQNGSGLEVNMKLQLVVKGPLLHGLRGDQIAHLSIS